MKQIRSKVDVREQAWLRYESNHEFTLDVDLKLGALMKMLLAKESDLIKLKYVGNESSGLMAQGSGLRAQDGSGLRRDQG